MTIATIKLIFIFVLLVSFLVVTVYLYIRERTLESIRKDVYQLFLKAEHEFVSGAGKQKFEHVIQMARSLLPPWAQFFITEELLRKVVQAWFDAVKDLLDDGKLNASN